MIITRAALAVALAIALLVTPLAVEARRALYRAESPVVGALMLLRADQIIE